MSIQIDSQRLPRHIAIIMDGNGRWAQQRSLDRINGHREGVKAVRATVRSCRELGIEALTLYAFSQENWSRPEYEVRFLMDLLDHYLKAEVAEMNEQGIRLRAIGAIDRLPEVCRRTLESAMEATAGNREMTLTLALSYSGREDIVNAVNRLVAERAAAGSTEPVSEEEFAAHLWTAGLPDPDLLIRTSGEFRLSNFLLWQSAYTELFILEKYWPDFRREDLLAAIAAYQSRERRFGMTGEQARERQSSAGS